MDEQFTFTRDEAIIHVVGALTQFTIDGGSELVPLVGTEAAIALTREQLDRDQAALAALGIPESEIRELAERLSAERESVEV